MTYRQILNYIKDNPGCLQTQEQRKAESYEKFRTWVKNQQKTEEEKK